MSSKKTTAPPAKATTPTKTVAVPTKKTDAPVPETILKRRKNKQELRSEDDKRKAALKNKLRVTKHTIFVRAEKYAKQYRQEEKALIRFRREAKAHGNFYLEPEAKLALVIRIRGINNLHPKPRKILQLLRLRQINNATFVRLTAATKQMLQLIEPYVAYGYPNLKTVRELIYKRGYGRVNGQRIPLSNNDMIEQALGRFGIICVEDLIHEIYSVGPHFKQANRFLWTFKLAPPTQGWRRIKNHYVEGGDFGNREQFINELVHRMKKKKTHIKKNET